MSSHVWNGCGVVMSWRTGWCEVVRGDKRSSSLRRDKLLILLLPPLLVVVVLLLLLLLLLMMMVVVVVVVGVAGEEAWRASGRGERRGCLAIRRPR